MNYRTEDCFEDLASTIRGIATDASFDYFPSPGNWGDALINQGTEDFFKKYRLRAKSLSRRELRDPKRARSTLAVVGGGGGWCRNWSSTPGFVDDVASQYEQVVLMPTTFDSDVRKLDLPNVAYFARDGAEIGSGVRFCHDMAFYIDYPKVSDQPLGYPLLAFRRDKERHPDSLAPDRNMDLSLLGNSWSRVGPLLEILSRFPEIYTDRLHLALAGARIGLRVNLVNGNYPKNERVFTASMEGRLKNVQMLRWSDVKNDPPLGFAPIGVPGYLPK